jgi:hypothetical protein
VFPNQNPKPMKKVSIAGLAEIGVVVPRSTSKFKRERKKSKNISLITITYFTDELERKPVLAEKVYDCIEFFEFLDRQSASDKNFKFSRRDFVLNLIHAKVVEAKAVLEASAQREATPVAYPKPKPTLDYGNI